MMNFSTITDGLYYACHLALPRFPLREFQWSGRRSPCLSIQICTTSRRGLHFTEVNTIEIWPSAVTIQPLIIFVVLISCAKLVTVVRGLQVSPSVLPIELYLCSRTTECEHYIILIRFHSWPELFLLWCHQAAGVCHPLASTKAYELCTDAC